MAARPQTIFPAIPVTVRSTRKGRVRLQVRRGSRTYTRTITLRRAGKRDVMLRPPLRLAREDGLVTITARSRQRNRASPPAALNVRWGPLLGSAGFTAIAVAILVFDPEERALGWMAVLFFGGCVLVLSTPLLSRSGNRVRIVSDGLESGFLFPLARAKQIVLVVACAGIAVAGVFITLSGSPVIGLACTVFMGGVGVFALMRLAKGGRGLLLTPTRVAVIVNGRRELTWDEIAMVALYGDASARVLGITAVDPGRIAARNPGAAQPRVRAGRHRHARRATRRRPRARAADAHDVPRARGPARSDRDRARAGSRDVMPA